MKKWNRDKGFTLIEIVVVLAVIASLASFITPMIFGYISDVKLRKAEADVKSIGAAMHALFKDTAEYPGNKITSPAIYFATDTGAGALPLGVAAADVEALKDHLIDNAAAYSTTGRFQWKGPYLERMELDSWGKTYLVRVDSYTGTNASDFTKTAWALSAGPDQTLDTTGADPTAVSNDDIGFRIK